MSESNELPTIDFQRIKDTADAWCNVPIEGAPDDYIQAGDAVAEAIKEGGLASLILLMAREVASFIQGLGGWEKINNGGIKGLEFLSTSDENGRIAAVGIVTRLLIGDNTWVIDTMMLSLKPQLATETLVALRDMVYHARNDSFTVFFEGDPMPERTL